MVGVAELLRLVRPHDPLFERHVAIDAAIGFEASDARFQAAHCPPFRSSASTRAARSCASATLM